MPSSRGHERNHLDKTNQRQRTLLAREGGHLQPFASSCRASRGRLSSSPPPCTSSPISQWSIDTTRTPSLPFPRRSKSLPLRITSQRDDACQVIHKVPCQWLSSWAGVGETLHSQCRTAVSDFRCARRWASSRGVSGESWEILTHTRPLQVRLRSS